MQGWLFNPRRSLFARAAMRRAVNYAIDRRTLAQHPIPESLAGRPTDQHIPPGWPGFRDATIYPLGGPDLSTARRLAGSGTQRHGTLYTCNLAACNEQAEIVRQNLARIGIDLEIRPFSSAGEMFARLSKPDEPFDLALFAWGGDLPDPSDFIETWLSTAPSTAFLDRTPLAPRMRAAARLAGRARIDAYTALDRDIAAHAAPIAPAVTGTHTDFFSSRIGCQVEHPLYGIDLAALCVR